MSIGGGAYGSSGVQSPGTSPTGYCTEQDVLYRLPEKFLTQLTNDTTGSGSPDTSVLNDLITAAYDLTNSILDETYDTPFASTPAIIKRINVILVIHTAFERQATTVEMPKSWQREYDWAMGFLEKLATQEASMPDVDPSVASSGATINTTRAIDAIDFTNDNNLESFF